MNLEKIELIQSILQKTRKIQDIQYKIIIVNDSYFFYVDRDYVTKYYEGGHKDLKGWYSGILSFTKDKSGLLYVFLSSILYDHLDTTALLLKIIYQMLIYLGEDFFRFKYKKMRKRLNNYLLENLPRNVDFDSANLDGLLSKKDDTLLHEKASIIIPHMSLFQLIEKLPLSEKVVFNLEDVKSLLQPFEYMPPVREQPHHRHRHS